jgi:hypothetical protein
LKEAVKNNLLVFLGATFVLGALIICTMDYFLWFDLSAEAKINASVLWLTSLAIFWYAYEAYQLKVSSSKQAETQEEIMLNEFLPILAPVDKNPKTILQNGRLKHFYVHNFGKGPAKYAGIFIGKVKVTNNLSVSEGEDEEVFVDNYANKELARFVKTRPSKIPVKFFYEDIYGRKFKTENVFLDRNNKTNSYLLRSGSWDFKRILPK